jgi:hypothetical protein
MAWAFQAHWATDCTVYNQKYMIELAKERRRYVPRHRPGRHRRQSESFSTLWVANKERAGYSPSAWMMV